MADKSWTTIAIKKSTVKRLHERKQYPKQTHAELIDALLTMTDKKQVKLDAKPER